LNCECASSPHERCEFHQETNRICRVLQHMPGDDKVEAPARPGNRFEIRIDGDTNTLAGDASGDRREFDSGGTPPKSLGCRKQEASVAPNVQQSPVPEAVAAERANEWYPSRDFTFNLVRRKVVDLAGVLETLDRRLGHPRIEERRIARSAPDHPKQPRRKELVWLLEHQTLRMAATYGT
jgi:hypothetical protein